MLKHIVLFKFKENNKDLRDAQILTVKGMLDRLAREIDSIVELKTGVNISTRAAAFDFALEVILENEEGLESYRIHPEHVKVLDYLSSVELETVVVDYFF